MNRFAAIKKGYIKPCQPTPLVKGVDGNWRVGIPVYAKAGDKKPYSYATNEGR